MFLHHPLALLSLLIVFVGALIVAPLLLRFFSSRGPSDSSPGGGGGGGSPPRPTGPEPGGVPLEDAQPAHVRLRDARTLAQRLPARQRRSTKEPVRAPGVKIRG